MALSLATLGQAAYAIDIFPTDSAEILGNSIFSELSDHVSVNNSFYTGSSMAAATYDNLNFSPFHSLRSGILLTTGDAMIARGPNDADSAGVDNLGPQESFLNYDGNGANADLYNVAKLSIEFECDARASLSFRFAFGSDEFFEWVNSPYNDTFLALIDNNPVTLSRDLNGNPITVNNQFFRIDNRPQGWGEYDYNGPDGGNYSPCAGTPEGIAELQYDGFTPVLRTTFTVDPGQHVLTFAIGDAGDQIYDSGVFISQVLGDSTDDDGTDEDPVPEPSSIIGITAALGGLALRRRRR